jgi:hypothetical protein
MYKSFGVKQWWYRSTVDNLVLKVWIIKLSPRWVPELANKSDGRSTEQKKLKRPPA